jgi:hypothetical protein
MSVFQAGAFQAGAFQASDAVAITAEITVGLIILVAKGKRNKNWPRLGAKPNHDVRYELWRSTKPRRRVVPDVCVCEGDTTTTVVPGIPNSNPMLWSDGTTVLWADNEPVEWSTAA